MVEGNLNAKLSLDVIRRLPKAELHRHLDGSVRPQTILDLANEQGVILPAKDLQGLTNLLCVSENCSSLVEYLRSFDITLSVMQKPYAISRITYEVCEDAVKDGVRYLEIRFSPILHIKEGLTLSSVMEAVCEGIHMAEYDLPIVVRVIVCGMRHMAGEVSESMAEIAWRYRDNGVVAFDLAGPEHGFSSKLHKSAFDIVRMNCLNCTLHSGEAAGAESIRDSIRYCGAHRIGHGVRLREDQNLLQYVIDRQICLEMCPTSNVQTKAVMKLSDHPIKDYFDRGVVVVPCTDNTTVSNVTLSDEYHKIQEHFGFTVSDIIKCVDNGFLSAFLDRSRKNRLRTEALHTTFKILRQEGFGAAVDKYLKVWDHDMTIGEGLEPAVTELGPEKYWDGHFNPPVTLSVIRSLPKVDVHCRLDGSVSIQTLWQEYQACDSATQKIIGSGLNLTEFRDLIRQNGTPSKANEEVAKRVMNALLQTRDQIRRGVIDVIRNAYQDGVVYVEIDVRPTAHLHKGLRTDEVVDIATGAVAEAKKQVPGINVGIVLYASSPEDDPLGYHHIAKLVAQYRNRGVVGFGAFGDEIQEQDFRFFAATFHFLKKESINCTMSAGRKDPSTILTSLHHAGAVRISSAYQLHKNPTLVGYMANHNIPVEIAPTEHMKRHTQEMQTFAGSPIRLMMDVGLPAAVCSIDKTLTGKSLSDVLVDVVENANCSIAELLSIIYHGYEAAFWKHEMRMEKTKEFWDKAKGFLSAEGFSNFRKKHFFPVRDTSLLKKFSTVDQSLNVEDPNGP